MKKIKNTFLGISLLSLCLSVCLSVPVLAGTQEFIMDDTQTQINDSNAIKIQNNVQVPPELLESKIYLQVRQNEESNDITSSDDSRRIPALEKEYGVKIDESMHWSVKYPDYTPMATLKELGYYHVNANRQNLIKFAIKTGDWQPYRAFEAKQTPLYFEIVDSKFEYSKIYWGKIIEHTVMSYRADLAAITQGHILTNYNEPQTAQSLTSLFNRQMKEYVEKFKAANGYPLYVVGLNNTHEYAKHWGVPVVEQSFFDSKYNHPDVMAKGVFGKE